MLMMRTGTSVCSRTQEIFPSGLAAQGCSGSQHSSAMRHQSAVGACSTFSYILGLPDLGQMSLLSNCCCCEVLLMPTAIGCCKRQKLLGSLVQQFPYHKQRATDKRILRACLSVPVNMKICCAPPTAK